MLGLLPTYQQIGVAAPLLLVTMRLIQGFSVGGEFTGSMVYTTESASPMMRGLVSSSTAAGVTIGFILGSGSAWLVNALMSKDAVTAWGWRIPFVGSVLLCVLGWFLRRGLHETAEGLKAVAARPPLIPSLIADWLPMVRTFGIVATTNAAYYLTFTYVVERRKSQLGGGSIFLLANTVSLLLVLISKPLGGWLSDRHRSPALDVDSYLHHDDSDLSSAVADVVRNTIAIHVWPDSFGIADRDGARTAGCNGCRNLPASHPGHIDELRLQHHPGVGGRHSSARVGVADRQVGYSSRACLLCDVACGDRSRLDLANAGDE